MVGTVIADNIECHGKMVFVIKGVVKSYDETSAVYGFDCGYKFLGVDLLDIEFIKC